MTDRNWELVPDNWSLVRERALTTGLSTERWYSEHSGVCRRVELPGRGVKMKDRWSERLMWVWYHCCRDVLTLCITAAGICTVYLSQLQVCVDIV